MSFLKPKVFVSREEFRGRMRSTILIVGDVSRRSVGRPKQTVLGVERSQITKEVAARVATALVAEMDRSREDFEPDGQFLRDVGKRSQWAAEQVNAMAATNREATDDDPFRLVEKMCGQLITIAYRKGPNNRREAVRIPTASATPAELRIFADIQFTKGRRENELGNRLASALRKVADNMAESELFSEGKARHFDNIRQGIDTFGGGKP